MLEKFEQFNLEKNPKESLPEDEQKLEVQRGSIDLSSLSFNFGPEDDVKKYYENKLEEIGDKDKWIKDNEDTLSQEKERIVGAVEKGLIPDGRPETIWQYRLDKTKEGQEKVLQIQEELGSRTEDIRTMVAERLSKFLPDWVLNKADINFKINEKADFCIDKGNITVDLGRLTSEKDFFEKTIQGITHEVFHEWVSEKFERPEIKEEKESKESLKKSIVLGTINEGMAVLVSGQSLKDHHEGQGKEYGEYIQESFESFNDFLSMDKKKELKRASSEEFRNMGHFYVVGNEIAQAVLEKRGINDFRKIVEESFENPDVMFGEYRKVCEENHNLPKLNPTETGQRGS